jgi:exodeoxyribonuclease VII small subunit
MAVRKSSTAAHTIEAGNPDVIAQYERSMSELEQIVARLEQGETTLEQSLADYERGALLARQCEQALKAAEQRIEALMESDEEESPKKYGKKDSPKTQPDLPPADAFFDV